MVARIIYRIRQHLSVEPKCFFAASLFAIRAFKQLSISWDWRQPAATGPLVFSVVRLKSSPKIKSKLNRLKGLKVAKTDQIVNSWWE